MRLETPLIVDFGHRREKFKFVTPQPQYKYPTLEQHQWCRDTFGDNARKWYFGNCGNLYFKRESYEFWHRLRWA